MVRISALALGLSVLTTTTTANPLERAKLVKRDIVADVSGSSSSQRVAADNHNAATWNKYHIGDWFKNMTKPWVVMNWNLNGIQATDIQSVVLYVASKEGLSKCNEISLPNCGGNGWDYGLCQKSPEAHFVWFAITNWANYFSKLHNAFTDSTVSLVAKTSNLVKEFYTPQTNPTNLILPVSIVSGFAAAISAAWPPAAVVAGAGGIINGALTQAGLNRANPLVQWADVQDNIGSAYTQIQMALETYYKYTLNQLPGPPNGGTTWYFGALAASAINALWRQDKVFIIKITDAAYGKGAGAACKAFPVMTACLNGVAYIFARWQMDGGTNLSPSHLDDKAWNVWGAYRQGSGNDNKLDQYKLNLDTIAASAQKTQDENGFDFKNQNGATLTQLTNHPTDLKLEDIMYWSLPICDIAAIIGPNKHLNGPDDKNVVDPIVFWGACTCVQAKGWPTDKDTGYPDDPNGFLGDVCRSHGWGNN